MEAGDSPLYVCYEIGKAGAKGCAPCNDHIIETGLAGARQGVADGLAQTPSNAIPLDGVSMLLGNCQADTGRVGVIALSALQQQRAGIGSQPGGCGQKILALDEPMHGRAPILS